MSSIVASPDPSSSEQPMNPFSKSADTLGSSIEPSDHVSQLILQPQEATHPSLAGGKASALAQLAVGNLPIPPWFVLTPIAFEISLTPHQRRALELAVNPTTIIEIIEQIDPAEILIEQLEQALKTLGDRIPISTLAVRSSAIDEDSQDHSFAGQLESILNVSPEHIIPAIRRVWQSGFSERVLTYRQQRGITQRPTAPAVLIQHMIGADTAGVAFAADPVSGRRSIAVISAVWGLGSGLVSGELDADTFHVSLDGQILQRSIGHKQTAHRLNHSQTYSQYNSDSDPFFQNPGTGIEIIDIPEDQRDQSSLTDDQVRQVADLARKTSAYLGGFQDIEWAFAQDQLFLLQSRPITSLAHIPDPDAATSLWDNSNISESYSGITTPLTFSFARRAYEEVYRQFCVLLGVPRGVIADQGNVFRHMIGLIRGRVYYNLYNWYRALALLPGFSSNRRFMEQMMGVREGLPPEIATELEAQTRSNPWEDRLRLIGSILGLVANYIRLDRTIQQFYERLDLALRSPIPPLEEMRIDQLVSEYRLLERQLLTRWDAPLINDFLAMIFFGVLGKLTHHWCQDPEASLANRLICGEGGIISTEPAHRIERMAELIADYPDLIKAFCQSDLSTVQSILNQYSAIKDPFQAQWQEYLDRFGDRCLEELKLESPSLRNDPIPLLRSIGYASQRLRDRDQTKSPTLSGDPNVNPSFNASESTPDPTHLLRSTAEAEVARSLAWKPIKRVIFNWVLRNARARIRDRENLRFERTRLFGRVRRIFVELGQRYVAEGILQDPHDIFYLEVEEALGFVEGSSTCTDLQSLVKVRKAEFERFRSLPTPADRFETKGAIPLGNRFEDLINAASSDTLKSQTDLQGLGCCPGRIEGKVRVIRDPKGAEIKAGEILVAERTDPGWIMLFPAAAGILVQRGSLLSHSAIVARELGIPAIVSIPGLMDRLESGQWVEMDGSSGRIRVINDDRI